MTNREYYKEQILDVACSGASIAFDKETEKIEICRDGFDCCRCLFENLYPYTPCDEAMERWSESEHIEKPQLTKNEKLLLSLLKEKWKYMTRDKYGYLWVHDLKPLKLTDVWKHSLIDGMRVSDLVIDMFSMVKWEDEEPWLIEDLGKLPARE